MVTFLNIFPPAVLGAMVRSDALQQYVGETAGSVGEATLQVLAVEMYHVVVVEARQGHDLPRDVTKLLYLLWGKKNKR